MIGDRYTAALIAADGTLDWLCLPHYRGEMVCASLLDAERGGHFRFGPRARVWGEQTYEGATCVLRTDYRSAGLPIVAEDFMALSNPPSSPSRVLVRRLRAEGSRAECVIDFAPRVPLQQMRLVCTHAPGVIAGPIEFVLEPGEEAWAVLSYSDSTAWTPARARALREQTLRDWRAWAERLRCEGAHRDAVVRGLLTMRMLGYAPTGALVAAPTTSLPERIGGDWNADYRLAWVRDGSLCFEALARHGDHESGREYFDWLTALDPTSQKLQVLYDIDGGKSPAPSECTGLSGYRGSVPVRIGNHAYRQRQLGSAAYLSDCAFTYLREGAPWRPEYFELIAREADYTAGHWDEPDNGIWELPEQTQHVSSRVASWVALERASAIADRLGCSERARGWRVQMPIIRRQVLEQGYSERRGAFRQAYGSDALDASSLLIPILGFLPPDDPRVLSTIDRIARELTINGHVYRFAPEDMRGVGQHPMGEFEGSFVLCTCWLATALALAGQLEPAEAALKRVTEAAGPLGLLPEGIDARNGTFLGNYPLLFSHAEYIRAILAVERARKRRG